MLDKPAIASMWKLLSSSFSNVTAPSRYSAEKPPRTASSFKSRSSMTASSSMPPALDAASVALGSVSIFTPALGSNTGTSTASTAAASFASSAAHSGRSTPCTSALRFASARVSARCAPSLEEKSTTFGNRLGADQNGLPVEVTASSGNVNVSCAILSWNASWNRTRAHATHSSYVAHLSFNRHSATFSRFSRADASPARRAASAYSAGLARYAFASPGLFSKSPSNSERAQVRQWSMLCGKECSVHIGADFSGGSRDAP
mmetsp:Transcript_9910/g.42139  ORF Transcript_9910/g.42139 Transcript_9910/m.42139 type:complete len:260 (-) Transcript_9910:879-1658(-)